MPAAHHSITALIAISVAVVVLLGHVVIAVVVIVLRPAVNAVGSLLWDLYIADPLGDSLRPYVEELRRRRGLPRIEDSPTRRERR